MFGVSYTIIPASRIMNGGVILFVVEVMCKAFRMNNMQFIVLLGKLYRIAVSTIGISSSRI